MSEDLFGILLIEDDSNDVLLIKRALAKSGINNPLQVLQDGEEAIAFLSGSGQYSDRSTFPLPSFIITDLKMPRAGGFEILKWLKDNLSGQPIPTLVFTSSRDYSDVKKAYALGAHSYLVKPGSFEELQNALKVVCDYWILCEKPRGNSSA